MKTNVLIFPAGEINSVELHEALSHNVNIEVFGASSLDRHGPFIFKNYRSDLPFINAPNFIDKFNELLVEWEIDLVFPTHDSVVLFLADNKEKVKAKIIVCDLETAKICRDKKKTYSLFSQYDFCPKIYSSFDSFPCFIKPRDGQGAVGAKLINSLADVPEDFHNEKYVITEYLPGNELTVDCITDSHGTLHAVLPRNRSRLMAGVCVSGTAQKATPEIQFIADIINKSLNLFGLWYFQIKQSESDKYKLLEVSARCAGTMCLSRARGINLPLLSVYVALDKEISVFENPYEVSVDRTLVSRYRINYFFDTVYIDYDDTVIENDAVCLPVIRFLYQCRNNGKKIILLTRHEEYHDDTIKESLKKHAISESLFSAIICIKKDSEKTQYIISDKAIFIDNAYAERKKVHDAINIPVFDVEGIEVISDWRC